MLAAGIAAADTREDAALYPDEDGGKIQSVANGWSHYFPPTTTPLVLQIYPANKEALDALARLNS
jgi:hypothetical protein